LLDKGAKTDETDNFGHTALFYAASNGQLEVVKLLLEKGAGADIDGKNHNGTPLLFAAQNGDIDVVKLLLAKGANPNAECNSKDKQGKPWTPLKIAEANNFTNIVELLQQRSR
jgi:ankyrin repeat protein